MSAPTAPYLDLEQWLDLDILTAAWGGPLFTQSAFCHECAILPLGPAKGCGDAGRAARGAKGQEWASRCRRGRRPARARQGLPVAGRDGPAARRCQGRPARDTGPTIVAIWPVELVANGCGADRGARSRRRGRPPADGVIQTCAARDTRRLVPPGPC